MRHFTSEALEGGGGSQYPISLIILKNISHIPKINMANIPKIQKALYPNIPKINPSIPYPFKYLQKYPLSLSVFCQYPCIPKNPSRALSVNKCNKLLYIYMENFKGTPIVLRG